MTLESPVSLNERLNAIEPIITSVKFRSGSGLGNDIPYYIFDYNPKDELKVRSHLRTLVSRINHSNLGFTVVEFNLYHLIYRIIDEKGYTAKCEKMEEEHGSSYLENALSKMLCLPGRENPIISYIFKNTPENAVVFLTGVGNSYPLIRAHTILNNLQQVFDTVPVVMFYPGKYTGQELQLFGTMKDDNYYRAFPFPVSVHQN